MYLLLNLQCLCFLFLIRYWLNTKNIINYFHKVLTQKNCFFRCWFSDPFNVHALFLGVKFDNDLYKLFRRIVMLSFIIFELIAQAYLIKFFFEIKNNLEKYINIFYLKIKRILIITLITASIIILPFLPFDNLKFLKHALEWNVFLGVIVFYLLTHLMWKKTNS